MENATLISKSPLSTNSFINKAIAAIEEGRDSAIESTAIHFLFDFTNQPRLFYEQQIQFYAQ